MLSFFFYFIFYLDIVLVVLASIIKFNHPAWVILHCTYGPSLLWTDFIMCRVNLVNQYLFSAVSYVQLLLCMSFISNYCLIRLFKWKKNPWWKLQKAPFYIHGPSLLWAEFVMGQDCYGPSSLWAEMSQSGDRIFYTVVTGYCVIKMPIKSIVIYL